METWTVIIYSFELALMVINSHQESGVFNISEQIKLPLRFCNAKWGMNETGHAYGHCMRRWNGKYAKFCKATSTSGSKACERLKKRMKNAIEKFNVIRLRSSIDFCDIGHSKEKAFDPAYQFCCENRIWKKRFQNDRVCCQKSDRNGFITTCCNSSEIDLLTLKRARCCNGNLADEENDCSESDKDQLINISSVSATVDVRQSSTRTPRNINLTTTNRLHEHKEVTKHVHTINGGRLKIGKLDRDVKSGTHSSSIIVYICVPVILVLIFVVLLIGCKNKGYKAFAESSVINSFNNKTYGTINARTKSLNTRQTNTRKAFDVRCSRAVDKIQVNSTFQKAHANVMSNTTMIELQNMPCTNLSNNQTQTETRKEINVKNSMGRDFCASYTFKRGNRSLQLPDSSVTITLSERDTDHMPLKCYASTFRNLWENYSKLEKLMSPLEQIASPAVEYFFPSVKRLQQFACVDMPIGQRGKDLHVWKVKSDQGKGKSTYREEIPHKKYIDITDETLDAYYEIVDGMIRIYVKSFSWLVCTVCGAKHDFTLSARIYTQEEPHTDVSKQVRVTLYILDGVRQLDDYLKVISEDANSLKLNRKINLPIHVALVDSLSIRILLLKQSINTWTPLLSDDEEMDMEIPIQSITQCHYISSNGHPFSVDWHFESVPYSITADKFTFQCLLMVSGLPQHACVSMHIPENKYVINKEIDFSPVIKRERRDVYTDLARCQIYQPVAPKGVTNYEALGARPRTTNRQSTASNVQSASSNGSHTGRQNASQLENSGRPFSSNNIHYSRCQGALPELYKQTNVSEIQEREQVRPELES